MDTNVIHLTYLQNGKRHVSNPAGYGAVICTYDETITVIDGFGNVMPFISGGEIKLAAATNIGAGSLLTVNRTGLESELKKLRTS